MIIEGQKEAKLRHYGSEKISTLWFVSCTKKILGAIHKRHFLRGGGRGPPQSLFNIASGS